jgi:hypothetical protein
MVVISMVVALSGKSQGSLWLPGACRFAYVIDTSLRVGGKNSQAMQARKHLHGFFKSDR